MCELLDDKLAYLLRRLVEQQWSHRLAHLQVLVQHFGRSLQIYHLALAVHVVDIVEEAWSAASARNHYILKLSHFVQQVVLDAAESFFAFSVEYLLHSAVHTCLDIPVEIVECDSKGLGECLAYGGLSGSHVANEDDSSHII